MDRQLAMQTARQYIPGDKVGYQAQALAPLALTPDQLKAIDRNNDQAISRAELISAFVFDMVKLPASSKGQAQAQVQFVEEPPQVKEAARKPPQRPQAFLPGAQTLGIGKAETQLTVEPVDVKIDTDVRDLDTMVKNVTTPEQVSELLDALVYDDERGKPMGGDGPLGTQTPEDTLNSFSGVCRDIHQLGAYILNQNGYNAVQIGYVANRTSHSFMAYQKGDSGYGAIEYGRVYTPEDIEKILGRPALSPREALMAIRPEAKVIFGWTPPAKGEEGYVKDVYYTVGHQLYQRTLKLDHQDSFSVDRNRGIEFEKTLGKHWSIKGGVNFDSPADPTAKHASHLAVGYQWGSFDNWGRVSLGAQYRPNEGSHVVGPNTWRSNPTLLMGASIEGKVTPFKHEFNDKHRTSTTIYGNASGAFLALNHDKASDAGEIKDGDYGYDGDYISGLPQANLRISQNFSGELTKNLSYEAEAFVDNDVYLAAAGYAMGGKEFYANVGVNGQLKYQNGDFDAHVGGQYLFHQVNNLEATGAKAGVGYQLGKVHIGVGANVIDSQEGVRLRTTQQISMKIKDDASVYLGASQENIFNSQIGTYSNPGGMTVQGGLQFRF